MTPLEFKTLQRDLLALEDCDLTPWERQFIDDMIAKADEYGGGVRLSPLQRDTISKLKGKHDV